MECEKCFSPWDTETHIPKILACGHTICQNCIYEISKELLAKEEKLFKIGQNQNRLLDFVELTFNYAKWIFSNYSCNYSNHIYNQPNYSLF